MKRLPGPFLSRREVLKLAGLGSLLGVSALSRGYGSENSNEPVSEGRKGKKTRVIVIGAGASGLAAAQALKANQEFEVIVLEARDRIGGRIWTDSTTFGTPVELGASWIHGVKHNPLYKFVEGHDIRTINSDYWSPPQIHMSDGKELCKQLTLQQFSEMNSVLKKVMSGAYAQQDMLNRGVDRPLTEALDSTVQRLNLSENQKKVVEHLVATEIENDYATQTDQLSLRYWDKVHCFKGADVLLPGGYKQVVELLSKGLDIRLGKPVREVNDRGDKIAIHTADGGILECDRVLVTVPLGVLKKQTITFSPPLPDEKLESIQRLGMGVFDKLYLQFPSRFWSLEPTWIDFVGDNVKAWPVFFNVSKFSGGAILAAFNVGAFAKTLEEKSESAVISDAMQILRKMFGADIPNPIATKNTSWGSDPYSQGSYSYIPVGASAKDYDVLAESVNQKIFFAGEACSSRDYSTVHAAYSSGLRAAREIIQLAG